MYIYIYICMYVRTYACVCVCVWCLDNSTEHDPSSAGDILSPGKKFSPFTESQFWLLCSLTSEPGSWQWRTVPVILRDYIWRWERTVTLLVMHGAVPVHVLCTAVSWRWTDEASIAQWPAAHFGASETLHRWLTQSLCIATRYGLAGPGIESQRGRDFPHPSRPAWCRPSLLCSVYRVFFSGVKWLELGFDHPTISSGELKKE